jgi:hypothetical protein
MRRAQIVFGLALVASVIGLALLVVGTAHAQNLALFRQVQPGAVDAVTLVRGMGDDERVYTGLEARKLAGLAGGLQAVRYTTRSRIQAYSWDWATNTERDDFTPLVWRVAVHETRADRTEHYTILSCYEVGDPAVYDCYFSNGHPDLRLAWHTNTLEMNRADLDAVLSAILRSE